MANPPFTFRDFGILPDQAQPPSAKIRSGLSQGQIAGQWTGTLILTAVGVGLSVLFMLTMPAPLSILAVVASAMSFGAFVYLAARDDYRWVELDHNVIRAKQLYTGRILERTVDEIECVASIFYANRRLEAVVLEKLAGRIKGVQIRFRDRSTPVCILRSDPAMTNAQEIIEAIFYRMGQVRELDAEIAEVGGQPLVRNVHWKGEPSSAAKHRSTKVTYVSLISIALLMGVLLGYWGMQQQGHLDVTSVPPHEISAADLIKNGPGANRHVIVKDFNPGGYVVETNNDRWTNAWIALLPNDAAPPKEIQVVLAMNTVHNLAQLQQLVNNGRITGVCSEERETDWGMTLKPELIEANQGLTFTSAWRIEEMSRPPNPGFVKGLHVGGILFLLAATAIALVALAGAVFSPAGNRTNTTFRPSTD